MGSLKNQFTNAIDQNFKPGVNKHNYTGTDRLIFSYSERNTFINISSNFVNYLKKYHPDIRYIRDIKPEITIEYFQHKSSIWSDATIKSQYSALDKISDLTKQTYKKSDIGFMDGVEKPIKIKGEENKIVYRTILMERSDYNKIIAASTTGRRNSDTPSVAAIKMASVTGARVSELARLKVKDIDLENNRVHLVGKGGKHRTLTNISPERIAVIKKIYAVHCKGKQPNDYVFTSKNGKAIRPDSINRQLCRLCQSVKDGKCTLADKYQSNKTGIHSIRKMWATERYQELVSTGIDQKKAAGNVIEELGHGRQRTELCRVYIKGIGWVLPVVTK